MKAIVQTGARSVETQYRERPTPTAEEVLVKVHSAGLCGSDANAYLHKNGYEWITIPRIMGHEYAGEVVEIGDDVSQFKRGDHVVEEPIHACGTCFQCKNGQANVCEDFSIRGIHTDGAYAEYTIVEEQHLHPVPDSVPLRDAAITEPTSIATHAVFDRSSLTPGDTVLVEGPGPIGLLTAVVADSIGASVIVSGLNSDDEYRLPILESVGIETINVENEELEDRADALTKGIGFDVVFDTTGHESGLEMGIENVRKGGEIVLLGLPAHPSSVSVTELVRGEIDVKSSYGSFWWNFEQALRLMEQGEIEVDSIAESYNIDQPAAAFESFIAAETCKPIFQFNS